MVWLFSLVVFLFPRGYVNPAVAQFIHRLAFLIVAPLLLAFVSLLVSTKKTM
jgi:hypothetical protein